MRISKGAKNLSRVRGSSSKRSVESLESRFLLATDLPILSLDPIFDGDGFLAAASRNDEVVAISAVGDINADGFDDFAVVGSGGAPTPERGDAFGAAYVIFGFDDIVRELTPTNDGFSTAFFDPLDLDGTNGFVIPGVFPDEFGRSVAGLGDTNGDGIDDVAFVVAKLNDDGLIEPEVKVLYGQAEPWPLFVDPTAMFSVTVEPTHLPNLLRLGGGDVNGDGLGDLIIGTLRTEFVHAVFGSDESRTTIAVEALNGTNGFRVELDEANAYQHVNSSDVNGDGIDDVLIGGILGDEGHIVFGSNDPFPTQISQQEFDGNNGFTLVHDDLRQLVGVGDINNDGVDDLAVLSVGNQVDIITGPVLGTSGQMHISDFPEDSHIVFSGFETGVNPGRPQVTGPGDINGDGIDDLLFGNPNLPIPNVGPGAGEVRVVFGHASLESSRIEDTIGFGYRGVTSEFGGSGLGQSVHSLGDFDGDGINDLLFRLEPDNGGGAGVVVFGVERGFPGDANQDYQIDFEDFLILAEHFGEEDAVFDEGDFDGDGRVSFLDFLVLAENFGKAI